MPLAIKPPGLNQGDCIRVVSLASPVQEDFLDRGCAALERLGYALKVDRDSVLARDGYFAGPAADRLAAFQVALREPDTRAIFCSRGGYGSNYLLNGWSGAGLAPKILLGSSDITLLQIYLWERFHWVTFYGPMVATNFSRGPGAAHGFDAASLAQALTSAHHGWGIGLKGEALVPGKARGILLGGCLTLVEASLGTPWELDTRGAILLLEDRGMKPYQVDRALMHLMQAGKFRGVAGILLGEFPECEPPAGEETVRDVARRILASVGSPVVWGVPAGHTERPALTLPLGVAARLQAPEPPGEPVLEILEPACLP